MTARIQNKNTNQNSVRDGSFFSIRTLNIFMLGLIVLVGFLYLTQVNASAVKGYVIRDLQVKLDKDTLMSKDLELTSQAKQSVDSIQGKIADLGLVPAGQIEYLQTPGSAVAVAR